MALVGALINQTNLYFPRTISAILLPDLRQQDDDVRVLRSAIEEDAGKLGVAKLLWDMNDASGAADLLEATLARRAIHAERDKIEAALRSIFAPGSELTNGAPKPELPESDLLAFRRAEFNIIRERVNDPKGIPNLRVIPSEVPEVLARLIAKVNLVERLRETRVFYGFDRLETSSRPLEGMPDSAMHQLFRTPPANPTERWLPAIEVFGEGLYLELSEEAIRTWQDENAEWLQERMSDMFMIRLGGRLQTLPPESAVEWRWTSRYLLVHSLAHVLINQLVFECGYGTASLRERLYISADEAAPMSGLLIYTAAGDSEGTLGGLVRLGRPARLGRIFQRALSRASWCSADPICAENLGGQGSQLANLAACHSCILLPETSCETINHGLDRAMVVGTPEERERGAFSALLDAAFVVG